jgi:hypothetical protein
MPDLAQLQVPGTQVLAWGARNAQVMFELNQALFGIGFDMLERQQEVVATAMQRLLLPARDQASAANDEGVAGFARLGMETFERMMAAMQFANDRARAFGAEPPAGAAPRQGG